LCAGRQRLLISVGGIRQASELRITLIECGRVARELCRQLLRTGKTGDHPLRRGEHVAHLSQHLAGGRRPGIRHGRSDRGQLLVDLCREIVAGHCQSRVRRTQCRRHDPAGHLLGLVQRVHNRQQRLLQVRLLLLQLFGRCQVGKFSATGCGHGGDPQMKLTWCPRDLVTKHRDTRSGDRTAAKKAASYFAPNSCR
jgi:hypothetical protein